MTSEHTYKVIELVGSSSEGLQQAIENAVSRASQSLQGLDWFEMKEIRGSIQDASRRVPSQAGYRLSDFRTG